MNKMDSIIKRVQMDSEGIQDFTLGSDEYFMDPTGRIILKNTNLAYELTDWAFGQALSAVGMPVRYERRLMEKVPQMVMQQFNFWKNEMDKPALLRTKHDKARGFLSPGYSIYNNEEFVDKLSTVDTKYGNPQTFYMDDHILHIRLVDNEPIDAGTSVNGVGDILNRGIDLLNSEVGACSLVITPMVYRIVCTNGLRAWREDENMEQQRYRHFGKSSSEFAEIVDTALEDAFMGNRLLVDKFVESKNKPLDNNLDPNKIIEDLLKKNKSSQAVIKTAQDEFALEPEQNMYGIINSITAAARGLKHEDRLQLEAYAGKVLASV